MANSTSPLLSRSDSSELGTPDGVTIQPDSVDELIEWSIEGLNSRQFLQAMLVSLAWFFDGQQACISDFTDAEPTWHCTGRANTTCDSSSNICDLSDGSWAWDGPVYKSVVSEWALECASYFITGLPTTCFYLGCLIGGFVFATLADSSLGLFNALVILPSYVASYFLIGRWKRKNSILSFTMLSGLLSIICTVVGSASLLEIGFELASFFCTCVAYNVLLIYTTELFPTRVRNSATSMMRQAVTLGVLFDPTLISAGRDIRYLTFLVFGLTIMCCGFVVVFLPETQGVTLCDTLDEQEQRISPT